MFGAYCYFVAGDDQDVVHRLRAAILLVGACNGSRVEKWMTVWRLLDEEVVGWLSSPDPDLTHIQLIQMFNELRAWAGGGTIPDIEREFAWQTTFETFEKWSQHNPNAVSLFDRAMHACAAEAKASLECATKPKEPISATEPATISGTNSQEEATKVWVIVESAKALQIPHQQGALYIEIGSDGAGGPALRTQPVPISQEPVWNHVSTVQVLGGTKQLHATLYRSSPLDMLVEAGLAPGGVMQRPLVGRAILSLESLSQGLPVSLVCDIMSGATQIGALKVRVSCVAPLEATLKENEAFQDADAASAPAAIRLLVDSQRQPHSFVMQGQHSFIASGETRQC